MPASDREPFASCEGALLTRYNWTMTSEMPIPGRPRRIKSLARFSAAIICLAICLLSALWMTAFIISAVRVGRVFDFAQEWTSARNFLVGLPVYLDYRQSLETHLGGSASPAFLYNAHPPGAVLVALPFGLLEYRAAYLLWSILSLLCLTVSLWMIAGARRSDRFGLTELCLLTLVVSGNSLMHQTVQGQLNLVLLVLITGSWWADRKNAPACSGVLIGIAAAVKLFPAFLVVYYLAQRKWRAVWGSAVAFVAVNGVGCLLFGVQAYRDYLFRAAPDVAKFRDTWPNASLLGFWSKLFDGAFGHVLPLWHSPLLAKMLTVISCLVLIAATWWSVARTARSAGETSASDPDRNLAFALCCAGMLLASPITWDHYFLLLIPALWFAWQACQGQIVSRTLIVLVAVALLWLNPFSVWATMIPKQFGTNGQDRIAGPVLVLTLISFQFYALLGFYLLVFAKLRRRSQILNPGRQ